MLLCCITLSSSRENERSAQEVGRRISGAVAGEIRAKSSQDLTPSNEPFLAPLPGRSTQKTTYQVPITTLISRITLFVICLSFSSPPLHPCRFIRPLSLSSLSLYIFASFCPFLVCLCVGLLACHDGSR